MKIHLDLDCFFVSAERTRYPFLKGESVVVVKGSDRKIFSHDKKEEYFLGKTGAFNSTFEFKNYYDTNNIVDTWKKEFIDENGKISGIVIAKSYEAKEFNIKTGTPLYEALKLCKNLYIIPSDHLFYQLLSQKLKIYLNKKIPILEQYSIDEFFGDLNGFIDDKKTEEYIRFLQHDISKKFDLPITIGASRSKWIAKLATNKAKPYGIKVVAQKDVDSFICDIPIYEFPGIGRKINKKLQSYRIHTLSELKNAPNLLKSYGKSGYDLYKKICGTDEEKVIPNLARKGVGISRNFKAITDRDEILRRGGILARYLSFTILKLNLNPTTFYFKLRFDNGSKNSFSKTLNRLFNEKFLIDLTKKSIIKLDIYPDQKIHYISINASNFASKENCKTFSIFDYEDDKRLSNLSKMIIKMREKYGVDIIKYANENL